MKNAAYLLGRLIPLLAWAWFSLMYARLGADPFAAALCGAALVGVAWLALRVASLLPPLRCWLSD